MQLTPQETKQLRKEYITHRDWQKAIRMNGSTATTEDIDWFISRINTLLEEREKKLKQKVGMMRQWLNEDRISETDRMVTSEQLLTWLDIKNN